MTQCSQPLGIEERRIKFVGMIQLEHIQVAIAVVIEEGGLAGI